MPNLPFCEFPTTATMHQDVVITNVDVSLSSYASLTNDKTLNTLVTQLRAENLIEEAEIILKNYHISNPEELIRALRHGLGTEGRSL